MADQEMLVAIATGSLIVQVDDARSLYDPFRLTATLEPLIVTRLAAAKAANSATLLTAGDQTGARLRVTEARGKLGELLRAGFAYLSGLTALDIPAADVADALVSYGWEGGLIGDLTAPARVEALAEQAAVATPDLDPAVRYPAPLLVRIANWLAVLAANKMIADGGTLETINAQKDAAREALLAAISRVRYFYCSAGDERDQTPELAKIGLQPRRRRSRCRTPGDGHFQCRDAGTDGAGAAAACHFAQRLAAAGRGRGGSRRSVAHGDGGGGGFQPAGAGRDL